MMNACIADVHLFTHSCPPLSFLNPSSNNDCVTSRISFVFPKCEALQTPKPVSKTINKNITKKSNQNLLYTIRPVEMDELWDMTYTHCNSFHPNDTFPVSALLRADRMLTLLGNMSLPKDVHRTHLIAVKEEATKRHSIQNLHIETSPLFRITQFSTLAISASLFWPFSCFWIDEKNVFGCVSVDTVAEFLLRKNGNRRKGYAYISNMAVLKEFRRKGIAMDLILASEENARRWGCKMIALHCDLNNNSSLSLYQKAGYRLIQEPEGTVWPKPYHEPDVRLCLMLKKL